MAVQQPFKWLHFEAEIILVCVRWYLRYALSYRDLEELMREQGVHVLVKNLQCAFLSVKLRALNYSPEDILHIYSSDASRVEKKSSQRERSVATKEILHEAFPRLAFIPLEITFYCPSIPLNSEASHCLS